MQQLDGRIGKVDRNFGSKELLNEDPSKDFNEEEQNSIDRQLELNITFVRFSFEYKKINKVLRKE